MYEGGPLAPARRYGGPSCSPGRGFALSGSPSPRPSRCSGPTCFSPPTRTSGTSWGRVIVDTALLAVASALALALVRAGAAQEERFNSKAALAALAAALFGLLLFWTGAAVVLGAAVFLLAWPYLKPLAYTGAGIALLNALYFPSRHDQRVRARAARLDVGVVGRRRRSSA